MATGMNIAPGLLSLAAANGLTPSMSQSWYPALVRTPRVLVPIELEVLMVRDTQQSWANCMMAMPPTPPAAASGTTTPAASAATTPAASAAPSTPAASLAPPLFSERESRPRGAYLQWYLPNGLTGGIADSESNSVNFPAIPDRWLVLRISAGSTPLRRAVTGWVLEAGSQQPVVTQLANWSEPGPATGGSNPLTALGQGDLAWAAYFDNVQNRLGFYDPSLDRDEVEGPLAYLVCGWYADPTSDPLGSASVTSLAAFNATMQTLGWQLDAGQLNEVVAQRQAFLAVAGLVGLDVQTQLPEADYTTSGNWWPTATVFHGAVVNIAWPDSDDTQEVGGPPAASSIVVAAGDTMAETLAALIANANAAPTQAPIVEALQLGVLAELDQPDGRAKLDAQLHASSFASQSGGQATIEPLTIAPSGPPPAAPANPPPPGPGIFAQRQSAARPFVGVGDEVPQNIYAVPQVAAANPVGQLAVPSGHAPLVLSEKVVSGSLSSIIARLGVGVAVPAFDPGGAIDAQRAVPRYFTPKDPILLVQGGKRAFTHDSSVKTENGMVVCRLTPVEELSWMMPGGSARSAVRGEDVLENGVGNGSVPLECEGLLRETVLLDNGSAATIAASVAASTAGTFDVATAKLCASVEQTAWYALRDPHIDAAPLLAQSGIAGTLPAPFSVAPAAQPWTPIHLDWTVEFLPSPNGENDWSLGELDFTLNEGAVIPAAGTGISCSGRSTLTGGASATLAAAVQKAVDDVTRIGGTAPVPAAGIEANFSLLAQTLSQTLRPLTLAGVATLASPPASGQPSADGQAVDPSLLNDISNALANMDVLSCGLNGLLTQLRGGVPGDGTSIAPGGVTPTPFFAVRAGFLRIVRLRLVDGFGQFVDLCGSDATHAAQGYLVSDTMGVPNQPGLLAQPPRFSAPTRAWFRYMSADQPGVEADYQTSPICGFLMPNHLDGSLEFFNADGSGAGSLQPNDQGIVVWQGAPGLPSTAGQDPAATTNNGYAAQLAASLVDWGVADAGQSAETALSALLRTIDSTLWTVDPFAHQGDEHLSLLVGHPVCVMRGLLRLDVADPVVTPDGTLATVPIRLGNLTQWNDGLLGYFVNDDYTQLYVADAASAGMARAIGPQQGFLQQINLVPSFYATFANDVAANVTSGTAAPGNTPATHPYINTTGLLWIRPNQTINLTLLVEPLSTVHATAGRVPRKEIGMRRTWVTAGLAAIAPTFRFGPVLVDPNQIRMPLATGLNSTWVWDYRADAVAWAENPVTNATDNALLGSPPASGSEGWLKLNPPSSAAGTSS